MCLKFTTLGCKGIGIRKSEFVEKTPFLCTLLRKNNSNYSFLPEAGNIRDTGYNSRDTRNKGNKGNNENKGNMGNKGNKVNKGTNRNKGNMGTNGNKGNKGNMGNNENKGNKGKLWDCYKSYEIAIKVMRLL